MFRQNVLAKFTSKSNVSKLVKKGKQSKDKQVEIIKLPSPILARLPKKILEKSKFFKKDSKMTEKVKPNNKQLYAQASVSKVDNILKIKENFSNLLAKKIENIYKIINNSGKVKHKLNMTTKDLSRKQIIIPIDNDNKSKFMTSLSTYITNLNSVLRNIKSNVIADFVQMDQHSIIITINKVTSLLDLQIIENYIKNVDHINSTNLETLGLP